MFGRFGRILVALWSWSKEGSNLRRGSRPRVGNREQAASQWWRLGAASFGSIRGRQGWSRSRSVELGERRKRSGEKSERLEGQRQARAAVLGRSGGADAPAATGRRLARGQMSLGFI